MFAFNVSVKIVNKSVLPNANKILIFYLIDAMVIVR